MRVATIQSADGLPLTYYVAGEGDTSIVITNAPGMSVRFWTQIAAALQDRYRLVAMEYRGFPGDDQALGPEHVAFPHYVDDLVRVMDAAGVERAHMVSWCLGAKVAWGLYREHPERVRSMLNVGIAYRPNPADVAAGPFSQAMIGIHRRLERDPSSVDSMVTMMQRLGRVPDPSFFSTVFKEEEDGHALAAMDVLDAESSMSSLAFYLLQTPNGLRNYLRVYQVVREALIDDLFPGAPFPVTIVAGSADRITPLDEQVRADLSVIPRVRFEVMENASHFLPIEYPSRLTRLIDQHVAAAVAAEAGAPA